MMEHLELEKPVVLIVDDDRTTLFLHSSALEANGFTVITAENGREAIEVFIAKEPNVILLDVQMPEMDGFEACRAIRNHPSDKDVPILMITGNDDVVSIQEAFNCGATDFITKPIKPIILTERVRYTLRASSAFREVKEAKETALKAQRIARLGTWHFNVSRGSLSVSDQFYSICGIDKPEGTLPWNYLVQTAHPDDRKELSEMMRMSLNFGRSQLLDHRILPPNGSERFVSHQIEVELDDCGNVWRLCGTIQDITDRKLAEFFEADKNRILHSIIQGLPLPNIFHEVVMVMERQRPAGVCCVCLLQGEHLKVMAAPGLSEKFLRTLDSLIIGPESGCFGSAAYLGKPTMAHDISEVPFWNNCREEGIDEGIQASLSVPILSGKGKTLGTISLFFNRPHHATKEEIQLAEELGQLAALAIEQCHLSELLIHQARHDSLTGLLNRSALAQLLGGGMKAKSHVDSKAGLLLIDLDRFKRINDSLGHEIGDLLLCQVGERLKDCVRRSDLLGRVGGDEFLLALFPLKDRDDARRAAERILKNLSKPFSIRGHQLHIGASIGISVFPDDGPDTAVVQKNADIAMYVAKNEGGNRYQFFSEEMNASVIERLQIENDLRKAIERKEFELHYQPQYDLGNGKLIALEALIRWNHPEIGRISPDRFIPIAEESSLIIPLGAWVIREACRQSAFWISRGNTPIRIAVNVSAVQFSQPDFANIVESALVENQLDPQLLEIEITESAILKDKDIVRDNLAKMKEMGVITTIDDFGTGYSSITYLRQMPLDCLKIDKSFIKELAGEDSSALRTQNLVKAFVSLAKNLNLRLVAEGIENMDQCRFVSDIGCELGQGYLFSAPLPAKDIAPILHENRRAVHGAFHAKNKGDSATARSEDESKENGGMGDPFLQNVEAIRVLRESIQMPEESTPQE